MVVSIKETLEKGRWGKLRYDDVKDFLKTTNRSLKFECFRDPEDQNDYCIHRKIVKSFNDWQIHDLIYAKYFRYTHKSWHFVKNDYPYQFKTNKNEKVEHYLLWLNPKFHNIHNGIITGTRYTDKYFTHIGLILVYQKFNPEDIIEVEVVENPQHMRTIPAIRHYHIFILMKM